MELPSILRTDAHIRNIRRIDHEINILCYVSRQNACDSISRLLKYWAILHFLPASRAIQSVVRFVGTLTEKLKHVFMLHLEINQLAKF